MQYIKVHMQDQISGRVDTIMRSEPGRVGGNFTLPNGLYLLLLPLIVILLGLF